MSCGLGNEKPVIDKAFCIFDEADKGSVDFKELLVGIEVFRQPKVRLLMQAMIEIADIKGRGTTTEKQLSPVVAAIFFRPDEKVRVKNMGTFPSH